MEGFSFGDGKLQSRVWAGLTPCEGSPSLSLACRWPSSPLFLPSLHVKRLLIKVDLERRGNITNWHTRFQYVTLPSTIPDSIQTPSPLPSLNNKQDHTGTLESWLPSCAQWSQHPGAKLFSGLDGLSSSPLQATFIPASRPPEGHSQDHWGVFWRRGEY